MDYEDEEKARTRTLIRKAIARLKPDRDKGLSRLITGLFWIFLAITIAFVIYTIFVPTPTEWGIVTGEIKRINGNYTMVTNATSFPNDFSGGNILKAVLRHLSLFPEYINSRFLITTISFAFLTMFIHSMGKTIEDKFKNGKGMPLSVYVEWALASLISGILFSASSIEVHNLTLSSGSIVVIVVFALVSYLVLYRLWEKLEAAERKR